MPFKLSWGARVRRLRKALRGLMIGTLALGLALYVGWRAGLDQSPADRLLEPGTQAFQSLTTDDAIMSLIKRHERLRLDAYKGAGGNWLIGYGHKATAEEGMTITEAEADALFEADLREVELRLKRRIDAPIRRREFSALVDLAYNVGPTRVNNSTLMKRFNAGDRQGAADGLLDWTKITVDGEKV
ncbi:MAG: lysozyme, partial [Pseudomonadota bacterium]